MVGTAEDGAVHVFLFQVAVHVADRIGPFRRPVDLVQHLFVRLDGVAVEQIVVELSVAVVLAGIRGQRDIEIAYPRLAVKGLEASAQKPRQRADLNAGARKDRSRDGIPQIHAVRDPLDVRDDVLEGPAGLDPHDVKVVIGCDLAPVEVQDLFPNGLGHAARAGNGQGHRFAEGDVHVEEGASQGDDLELVLDVVEIALDHLGRRDQLFRLLVGHKALDGRDDARLAPLLADHRAQVVQEPRQAVHGNREKDEVVLVDDLLKVARCRHLRRQPGNLFHPSIEARQV